MAAPERGVAVRPSRPDDVTDLVAIEQRCFESPNTGLLMRICGTVDTLLVWEGVDAVTGYVLGAPTSAHTARIVSLAVAPGYRRSGIGTALMRAVLDRLQAKGIGEVELETRVSNDGATALYERLGFETVAVKEGYYDDGEDAFLMRTALPR